MATGPGRGGPAPLAWVRPPRLASRFFARLPSWHARRQTSGLVRVVSGVPRQTRGLASGPEIVRRADPRSRPLPDRASRPDLRSGLGPARRSSTRPEVPKTDRFEPRVRPQVCPGCRVGRCDETSGLPLVTEWFAEADLRSCRPGHRPLAADLRSCRNLGAWARGKPRVWSGCGGRDRGRPRVAPCASPTKRRTTGAERRWCMKAAGLMMDPSANLRLQHGWTWASQGS